MDEQKQGNWWDNKKPAEPTTEVKVPTTAVNATPQPMSLPPIKNAEIVPAIPIISVPVAEEKPKNEKAGAIWIRSNSMRWVMEDKTTIYTLIRQGNKKNEHFPDWRGDGNVAAWERTYGGTKKMLTISVGPKENTKKYVAFANSRKKTESKAPDFWVFVSKPMPEPQKTLG